MSTNERTSTPLRSRCGRSSPTAGSTRCGWSARRRMRDVDESWPAVGSRLHHSVGVWPGVLDDDTEVLEVDPGRRLVLQARAWPGGEATVSMELTPVEGGTRVTMREDATKGPGTLVPQAGPLADDQVPQRRGTPPARSGRGGPHAGGPEPGLAERLEQQPQRLGRGHLDDPLGVVPLDLEPMTAQLAVRPRPRRARCPADDPPRGPGRRHRWSTRPRAPRALGRAGGHLGRTGVGDERPGLDAQQVELHLRPVGHDAALEPVGRRPAPSPAPR